MASNLHRTFYQQSLLGALEMKKTIILAALLGLATPSAFADQILCRGVDTTMRITDVDASPDENYVMVQVWSADIDGAKYADLFTGSLEGSSSKTVLGLKNQKTFSSKTWKGDTLKVDLVKGTLVIESKGSKTSDSFKCKYIKQAPIADDSTGG